jgi:hypothetical protein
MDKAWFGNDSRVTLDWVNYLTKKPNTGTTGNKFRIKI